MPKFSSALFRVLLGCAVLGAALAPPRAAFAQDPAEPAVVAPAMASPEPAPSPAPPRTHAEPTPPSMAELFAEVGKLNAKLDAIMESQRRAQAHTLWRVDKERQLRALSLAKPFGLMVLGVGAVAPCIWLGVTDKDALVPTVTVGLMALLPLFTGVVLLQRSVSKRRALRREIEAGDAAFQVAPVLGVTPAGLALHASF
jgi:hypothetical protein